MHRKITPLLRISHRDVVNAENAGAIIEGQRSGAEGHPF